MSCILPCIKCSTTDIDAKHDGIFQMLPVLDHH